MAQHRSITSHPIFAPLIALWFAALLGLTVAVLPAIILARALAGIGFDALLPLTPEGRIVVGISAAVVGGIVGFVLGKRIARRLGGDPRPIYSEPEPDDAAPFEEPQARRPLHVREELAGGFGDESQVAPTRPSLHVPRELPDDAFMILTPQPIHPPEPQPDLAALLAQFDSSLTAFEAGHDPRAPVADALQDGDPVQAFVARQTGAPSPAASPIGGAVPDHQGKLREALDKLAQARAGD